MYACHAPTFKAVLPLLVGVSIRGGIIIAALPWKTSELLWHIYPSFPAIHEAVPLRIPSVYHSPVWNNSLSPVWEHGIVL